MTLFVLGCVGAEGRMCGRRVKSQGVGVMRIGQVEGSRYPRRCVAALFLAGMLDALLAGVHGAFAAGFLGHFLAGFFV